MPNLLISDPVTVGWKSISVKDARLAWVNRGFFETTFDKSMERQCLCDWSAVVKLENGDIIVRMHD